MRTALALLVLAPFVLAGGNRTAPADVVFLGGSVWTGVPGAPRAEAIAVRDGKIVATAFRSTC